MFRIILLLSFLTILFLYFKSTIKKNEDFNNTFKPNLLKTIIIINVLGVSTFLMPWINLPLVGGKNAIELTSKAFSIYVQEEVLVSMVILLFFYLIVIIGSILQLNKKVEKSKFTLYFEATIGLLITLKGILTISHFKEIWNSPTDNIIGDALAMSASPGFGLYLVVIVGITQVVSIFTFKN